ncbi:MAG TPA: ATP-binding protein [Trebonia sp.]|nr:ATP-binding protein [Trebonia sp.]
MTDGEPLRIRFTGADLPRVRQRVGAAAAAAGLDENRCEELVLAVYELACNAILHGGGGGRLLLSRVEGSVRCQVSDDGPGFGDVAAPGGGLWLAGQLSDRMEIDGGAGHGAVVTLLVRCRSNAAG